MTRYFVFDTTTDNQEHLEALNRTIKGYEDAKLVVEVLNNESKGHYVLKRRGGVLNVKCINR